MKGKRNHQFCETGGTWPGNCCSGFYSSKQLTQFLYCRSPDVCRAADENSQRSSSLPDYFSDPKKIKQYSITAPEQRLGHPKTNKLCWKYPRFVCVWWTRPRDRVYTRTRCGDLIIMLRQSATQHVRCPHVLASGVESACLPLSSLTFLSAVCCAATASSSDATEMLVLHLVQGFSSELISS